MPHHQIVGSLNYGYKKKIAVQIDQENIGLAKRILNSSPSIDHTKLIRHEDYANKIRDQISKTKTAGISIKK